MKRSDLYISIRSILVERFPVFVPKDGQKVPLALGIYEELKDQNLDISAKNLRFFLKRYTDGDTYLAACHEGAVRFNLRGDPSGVVSQKEAHWAVHRLHERRTYFRAKDAA